MSALRETAPGAGPGYGVPVSGRSSQARRPAAKRPVGSAGVQRRSLQRDLARREANLRINRRVSGAAAGIARPPVTAPAAHPGPRPGLAVPGGPVARQAPTARSAQPPQRPAPNGRSAAPQRAQLRPAVQPRPAALQGPGVATQSRAGSAQVGGARIHARVASSRPVAPYGVGQAAALAAALSPAAAPPRSAPARPILTTLPGGAEAAPARKERRFSNPAVLVASFVVLVLTVGAIVGLQIRMTQVNEQMGADLAQINVLQQKNTALKEGIARAASQAQVDSAATSDGIIEPDVADVQYTKVGNLQQTVAKAARVLESAPEAPTAAAADTTAPGVVITPGATTGAGVTP